MEVRFQELLKLLDRKAREWSKETERPRQAQWASSVDKPSLVDRFRRVDKCPLVGNCQLVDKCPLGGNCQREGKHPMEDKHLGSRGWSHPSWDFQRRERGRLECLVNRRGFLEIVTCDRLR